MLSCEIKKALRVPFVLVIFSFVLLKIFSVNMIGKDDVDEDTKYEAYIDMLKGPLTTEKEEFIWDEQQKISDILQKADQMGTDYLNGKINRDMYAEYNDQLFYAESHQQALEHIYEDYEYIKTLENKGYQPEFLNYRYWNHFFAPDTANIFLILIIIFIPCYYFSIENTSNMWKVIHAAYLGKMRIIRTKILACSIYGAVITIVFFLVEFICFLMCFGMDGFHADIQSIKIFDNLPFHISIGQGVFLLGLWKVMAASLVCSVLFLLSYVMHRDRINFLVCFSLLIFPVFIKEQFEMVYRYTFYSMLNGVSGVIYAMGDSTSGRIISIFSVWGFWFVVFILLYFLVRKKIT